MMKLKDSETRVTVGDIITLMGKKCGDCRGYQKIDGKIHHMTLSDTAWIPGLNTNTFSVTRSWKKGFQVTSEVEAPILKNNSTKTQLDEKMANHGSEGFILTTNIYKSANNSALLAPNKWKPEVKASVQAEGTSVKNQEKMTTKQLATL